MAYDADASCSSQGDEVLRTLGPNDESHADGRIDTCSDRSAMVVPCVLSCEIPEYPRTPVVDQFRWRYVFPAFGGISEASERSDGHSGAGDRPQGSAIKLCTLLIIVPPSSLLCRTDALATP